MSRLLVMSQKVVFQQKFKQILPLLITTWAVFESRWVSFLCHNRRLCIFSCWNKYSMSARWPPDLWGSSFSILTYRLPVRRKWKITAWMSWEGEEDTYPNIPVSLWPAAISRLPLAVSRYLPHVSPRAPAEPCMAMARRGSNDKQRRGHV